MIDIPTLFFVNIALGLALAICVLVLAIGRHKQLFPWSIAFGIHALSYVLISQRGIIDDLYSVILANMLIAAMLALFTEGMYRFEEVKAPRLAIWWPVLFIAISFWIYADSFETRVIIGAAVSVYQTGLLVWVVARDFHQKSGQGKWIIMIAAIMSTAMFVFRAGIAISGEDMFMDISSASPVQSITFIGSIVALVMFAFGLLTLFVERAELTSLSLALHDPLTQLGNRRELDNALARVLRQKKSQGVSALVMLDLDLFKPLNDTYGHAVGDQLLIEVAYRVKESVKAGDTVVRTGGDEFVVLLANLSTDAATARTYASEVANRMLAQVAKPYHLLRQFGRPDEPTLQYTCTCSVGVTLFNNQTGSSEIILEQADVAMYKAKQEGRNRVVFYTAELETRT